MTSPLTVARGEVAAALAGLPVPVHAFPPAALQPPCVVLFPGSPWIATRGHVTLEITAYANPVGGVDALTALEDLVEGIRAALWAAGLGPGDTDQPRSETDAGALSATTPVTLRTTCR